MNESCDEIAFIGIGTMGTPMVRRLVCGGYRPLLYDIDKAAAEAVAIELGLEVANSLNDLSERCDVVIMMLPGSNVVRQVCFGANGIADGARAGLIIVDMSSSDAIATRELGDSLANRGITLLDAPVSGGVRKAAEGTLAIMLGGENEDAVSRVLPFLESLGQPRRIGSLGSGHAAKALNNYVSAAGLTAACEAVLIGREFGLDPHTFVEVLNASTGKNNSTENKLVQFMLSGEFTRAGFALSLMTKDVDLANTLAEHVGFRAMGLQQARRDWMEAQTALGEGADHTEIFRFIESRGRD